MINEAYTAREKSDGAAVEIEHTGKGPAAVSAAIIRGGEKRCSDAGGDGWGESR